MSIVDFTDDKYFRNACDDFALISQINDKESDIYNYFHDPQLKYRDWNVVKGIIHAEGTVNLDGNRKKLDLTQYKTLKGIQCNPLVISDFPTIDPSVITSNISAFTIVIRKCHTIKNINIEIDDRNFTPNSMKRGFTIHYGPNFSFDNVNLHFDCTNNNRKSIYYREDRCFMDLRGLRSNTEKFVQYTLGKFPRELMKLFKSDWECTVYDREKGADVMIPIKNLEKAVAIANNQRRYVLHSHILDIKPNVKFGDLINTKDNPDLARYDVQNNNVKLSFIKEDIYNIFNKEFDYHLGLARTPEEKLFFPKTADGWFVIWYKI